MAKIEFSNQEIEILKKVAEENQKNGEEKAKEMLKQSGITVELSPEVRSYVMPDMAAANESSDYCYACIACLFTSTVAFVGFTK